MSSATPSLISASESDPVASKVMSDYIDCVMKYGNEWPVILEDSTTSGWTPSVLQQLLRVDFAIAAENPEEAKRVLDAASAALGDPASSASVDSRVPTLATAYEQWLAGDFTASARAFEAALVSHPDDLFSLKRAQLLYFLAGQPDEMLRVTQLPAVTTALTGSKYYHGLLAFALEQVGQLKEAEEHGVKGVELFPKDLWAVHAVAHSRYFQGRLRDCLTWLEVSTAQWEGCSFIVSHLWWHVALCHIDLDDLGTALKVYDDKVYSFDKNCMQDIMGAVGLLLKIHVRQLVLELTRSPSSSSAGAASAWSVSDEVLTRLKDVLPFAESKVTYHGDPFFNTLLAYTFAVTGRDDLLTQLLTSAEAHVGALPAARKDVVGTPWLSGMRALAAFGKGDAPTAVTELQSFATPWGPDDAGAVRLQSASLGNSSEQRDVLDETLVVSLILSGDTATAGAISTARQKSRPDIPADLRVSALCDTSRS